MDELRNPSDARNDYKSFVFNGKNKMISENVLCLENNKFIVKRI